MKTAHCCSNPSQAKTNPLSATDRSVPIIGLVGNPNSGKTTLFNALTSSNQKVGNYPGVTVEKVSGKFSVDGLEIECIDLPGLYSLNPISEDEQVALDSLKSQELNSKIDLIIYVLDGSNLERNLYLFSKIAELQVPCLVALTMVDRLEKENLKLEVEILKGVLEIDVVPVIGRTGRGIPELKAEIKENLENPKIPPFGLSLTEDLKSIILPVHEHFVKDGLEVDLSTILREITSPSASLPYPLDQDHDAREVLSEAKSRLEEIGESSSDLGVNTAYIWASEVQKKVIHGTKPNRTSMTDKIDRILMHRFWGLLVFSSLMYVIFQSIYTFAQPLMDGITACFLVLSELVKPHLAGIPWLQSLICDGIINGVGSMLVFLPQIMILFFFIAALEGSGYLARAAFLMDRLFGWTGLNGRAFIPLLSSFACAIPGIMAARVMPDKKSRLATILVAPLMSCSARLPVYLLLIGAFIEPKFGPFWAGFALFAMYLLGLAVAIPVVWVLNRKIIRGRNLPFTLELPPYQWPKLKDVWIAMYTRAKVFVTVAGTTIVMMAILIWFLSYFPRPVSKDIAYQHQYVATHPKATTMEIQKYVDEERLGHSVLGRFGKSIQPIFQPAGFDWRITTGILSAFPARETIIPSLGILFKLGSGVADSSVDLRKSISTSTRSNGQPLLTPYSAVGLMIFFALCCQCFSTLATVKRETNSWKWPVFMFTYMTAFAYIGAVLVNQFGIWMMSR